MNIIIPIIILVLGVSCIFIFRSFKKENVKIEKSIPLLVVKINNKTECEIFSNDLPSERKFSVRISGPSVVEFIDNKNIKYIHNLADYNGWYHFSVRLYPNLACQSDCINSNEETVNEGKLKNSEYAGIRFQPFFLSGSIIDKSRFVGSGLFVRGLHYNGIVTNSKIILSCVCDSCLKSFQIKSVHMGFNNMGYFYSESGKYTLLVDDSIDGCPRPLSVPDGLKLHELEIKLPLAPDGTKFLYHNGFKCPYCDQIFINLQDNEVRKNEYYGSYHIGNEPILYKNN